CMRQLTRILLMIAAVLAPAALLAAPAAPAAHAAASGHGAAPAVVLVNQPVGSVCVGRTFRVGVFYQQYSGGSRAYRVAVYNRRGGRPLYRHGRGSSARWKFWTIRPKLIGVYRTVYSGHWRHPDVWTKYRATTRSKRC